MGGVVHMAGRVRTCGGGVVHMAGRVRTYEGSSTYGR